MVPQNPATRARINRIGSYSSGSEISCDTGFESRFRREDFSGSNSTKIGTSVATLPGAWRYRVSAGTGWLSVSIL